MVVVRHGDGGLLRRDTVHAESIGPAARGSRCTRRPRLVRPGQPGRPRRAVLASARLLPQEVDAKDIRPHSLRVELVELTRRNPRRQNGREHRDPTDHWHLTNLNRELQPRMPSMLVDPSAEVAEEAEADTGLGASERLIIQGRYFPCTLSSPAGCYACPRENSICAYFVAETTIQDCHLRRQNMLNVRFTQRFQNLSLRRQPNCSRGIGQLIPASNFGQPSGQFLMY